MNRKYIYILITITALFGCSKSDSNINTDTLKLKLTASIPTKAHFISPSDNNSATFVWDSSKDMLISLMKSNKSFVKWNSSENYSLSTITPDKSNPKIASVESLNTLNKSDLLQGGTILCFAPINEYAKITSNTTSQLSIDLSLPSMFNVSGDNNLSNLNKYTYVYGVSNITNNNQAQASVEFNNIPAIIKLKVKNSTQNAISLKSVKLTIKDKTSKKAIALPNKLTCSISNSNITLSESNNKTEYHQSIGVNITNDNSLAQNSTANYYLYTLPTDNDALQSAEYEFIITDKNNKEYKITNSNINIAEKTGKHKFCNGYIYTFNIDILGESEDANEIDPDPQNTSYKQRVLGLFFTGTDCSKCPSGIFSMHSIQNEAQYKDKVIFAELHSSSSKSPLYTSFGYGMLLYCGNATPTFDFNMKGYPKKGSTSVNSNVLKNNINTELGIKTCAGIAAKVYQQNDQIVVDAYVKVSKSGNYAIGAWILEDKIYESQSNSVGYYNIDFNTHNNVYRTRDISYSPYINDNANRFPGVETSEINPSKMFTKKYTFNIDSKWVANNCKAIVFVSVKDNSSNKYYVTNVIECGINKTQPFEYN